MKKWTPEKLAELKSLALELNPEPIVLRPPPTLLPLPDGNMEHTPMDWSKLQVAPPIPPCPRIDLSMLGPDTPAWLRREVQRLIDLDTPLHTVIALGLLVRLWEPPTEPVDPSGQVVQLIRDIPRGTIQYVERRARTMATALLEELDPLDRDDLECVFAALCQRNESLDFGRVLYYLDKHYTSFDEGAVEEDVGKRLQCAATLEPGSWWAIGF